MTNENRYGWSKEKGYYGESQMPPGLKHKPSDLELKIRKEVIEATDALVIEIFKESSSLKMQELSEFIQDRLHLLWGD